MFARSLLVPILPILLVPALAAHADTITTFNFTGSSIFYGMAGDTNTVTGTTTIDTTTGLVQSISFVANGLLFAGVNSQIGAEVFVGPSNAAFSFSEASLVGYTGSTFNLNGANDLYVGSLTSASSLTSNSPALPLPAATALTPEPAGLLLMSTGLVGLSLLVRRRPQGLAG